VDFIIGPLLRATLEKDLDAQICLARRHQSFCAQRPTARAVRLMPHLGSSVTGQRDEFEVGFRPRLQPQIGTSNAAQRRGANAIAGRCDVKTAPATTVQASPYRLNM